MLMAKRKADCGGAVGKGGVNPAPVPDNATVRVAAEQLTLMPIDDLVPYANNARVHDKKQIAQLRASLREFGFVTPVLIDFDNNIIAGHGRVEAARAEGMTEVPCVLVSNLTEAQRKAYILADNRLSETSVWDTEMLQIELEGLDAMQFDTGIIGFDVADVRAIDVSGYTRAAPGQGCKSGDPDAVIPDAARKLKPYGHRHLDDAEMEALRERADRADHLFYSYSGGRDSTRALVMTYETVKNSGKSVEVLYVDNGYELPDLKCHIQRVCDQLGAPLRILHSDIDYLTYYKDKSRLPDSIHRDCIELTINRPMDRYIAETVGDDDYVLVRGGKAKQRTALSGTQLYQTVDAKPHMIIWNPLFEMDEDDLNVNIPEWIGYQLGFDRTACWCCPFQKPAQWETLKKYYPLLHDELRHIFETIPFTRHPGDGYLKYIDQYWSKECGADVLYR